MPCFGPLTAYRPRGREGRLVFDKRKSETGIAIKVPCGRCTGCRLERSRQWAMRCMHEKRLHNMSSFLTLTYDDAHMPAGGTLVLRDLQLFMKRLRKVTGNGLRFYACGEYGDVTLRPHYHVLLFNYDFDDRKFVKLAKGGERLYSSESLDKIWSDGEKPLGLSLIGDVTFESCAYVARYIMKKQLGKSAEENFRYCPVTGVVALPEFTVMSRRPGLGHDYYVKFGREMLIHDSVVVNGREVRPPRYYESRMEAENPSRFVELKVARRRHINREDNTSRRLRVKEVVAEAALKLKGRTL